MDKKTVKKSKKTTGNNKKDITKLFDIYFWQYILLSVGILTVGLFLLFEPATATRTAEIATAICLIVIGLGAGFNYTFKQKVRMFDFSLVFGAIALILGALIITNPFALTNFLAVAYGVFLIISGLVKFNYAVNFKDLKQPSWVLVLTIGIISVVFGTIVIINPFANLYFTQVIGLFMVLYAVMETTFTILLKQRSKEIIKLLK